MPVPPHMALPTELTAPPPPRPGSAGDACKMQFHRPSPQTDGFASLPRNRRLPERMSRIRKIKGWSARKTGGFVFGGATDLTPTTTPVAAAASVPASLTSTQALWNTPEM